MWVRRGNDEGCGTVQVPVIGTEADTTEHDVSGCLS